MKRQCRICERRIADDEQALINDDDTFMCFPCWGERIFWVNGYRVERHYGGPEEGGWWYNAGDPIASMPIRGWAQANSLANDMQFKLAELFKHGNIYSARGGVDVTVRIERDIGKPWPEETPHYE